MKRQIIILLMIALMVVVIPTEQVEAETNKMISIETSSSYVTSGSTRTIYWNGYIDMQEDFEYFWVYVEFVNETWSTWLSDFVYTEPLKQGRNEYSFRTNPIDDNYYNFTAKMEESDYQAILYIRYSHYDETQEESFTISHNVDFTNTNHYSSFFIITQTEIDSVTNTLETIQTEYTTITEIVEGEPNNTVYYILLGVIVFLYLIIKSITYEKKSEPIKKPIPNTTAREKMEEDRRIKNKCKACDNINPTTSKWCMNCGTML